MPTDAELDAVPGSLAAALCAACMAADGTPCTDDLTGYRIAVGAGDWWYSDLSDTCDVCGASGPELFQGWLVPVA